MAKILRETWRDLNRSILVGERYEKNTRGIALVALLIVVVNIVTGCLNLMNGYFSAAATAPLFILAGTLILYFIHVRKNRTCAVVTAMIAVIAIFTYETFTVTHGFTIFWTLLLPMAFGYFASVKAGIFVSLYFLTLYCVVFFSPLRETLGRHYSDIIAQRFPILYLADVTLTTFIIVQYHRITLHQMDNARQLEEAKAAADRANASKSEFLANMSHEIRTPINAVLGMNEMILRECAAAQGKDASWNARRQAFENIGLCAGNLQSAGNNLLAIINNILDFSKIEANRMEIVEGPYKFSSVLNDVTNLVYFRANEKGLALTVDVDQTIPDGLYGDEVRVRQAITNILNNAVKYTEKGGVNLSVRQEPITGDGAEPAIRLIVAVRDTGIGIREEDIGRLFTKFERIDLKANSTVEGTGLGLVITKALMTMMGGSIAVESVYGEGSTFTLILPQKVVSPEPVGDFRKKFEISLAKAKEEWTSFFAPDARILIVDDTRMNLMVASGLLKRTGMQIDTAESGAEAIELAERNCYDLILMDQRMPQMDGTQTMRQIRDLPGGADMPIICLTADAISGARERYLGRGFTDYLSKPIDSEALEQMLIRHLPKERVNIRRKEEAVGRAGADGGDIDTDAMLPLRKAGIDVDAGLRYCQGDESLYRAVVGEFAQSAPRKKEDIQRCFESGDWENYAILVHALKSTSKTIGASALSGQAAALENAARQGDEASVRHGHPDMIRAYSALVEALAASFTAAEQAPEEEEILECPPEEENHGI